MKKEIRRVVAIVCLSILSISFYGQDFSFSLPEIVPASPEASAIAKYINYPVDYSTGLVKIEIPLYEIKAGDLTLPISLSYHASGIKANENAGWIGLGWTLNAEPMVSRSVKGNPDEKNQVGLLDNNSANWNDGNYLKMLVDGGRDEQPDDFYYRLLDKSGGFIFKKDVTTFAPHSLLLHPYEPVKIDFNRTFPYKFEITDEGGVYYRFGISLKDERFLEHSESPGRGQNLTGWKVSEIISANKCDTISFNYINSIETITSIADYITVEDSLSGVTSPPTITGCSWATFPFIIQHTHGSNSFNNGYIINQAGQLDSLACDKYRNSTYYIQSYTIRGKKIKQIHFRGGRVEFETEPTDHYLEPERWIKLKSIRVFDSNNNLVREISFHRSFFGVLNSSSTDFTKLHQRDRLDEITIHDHAGRVVERYQFGYNNTSLPASLTKNTDHWGYYNAAANPEKKSAVPVCTVNALGATMYGFSSGSVSFQIGRANKEPNETAMQYGILNSITYPTGGSTTFTYQPHKYLENGVLKNSGGLRIASIRDNDPESGKSIYQVFRYGKNGNGAGFIRWNISPGDYMYQQENYYIDELAGGRTRHRTYYSSTLSDLFYANGSTVVYDEVTVYRSNTPDATGTLGKTIYTFDQSKINSNKPRRVGRTNIFIGDRTGWMHGKLLREAVLHQNGDTLSTTTYRYATYKEDVIPGGTAYRCHNLIGGDHDAYLYESIERTDYTIHTGSLRPKSVKKTDRFSSAKIETNKEYEYSGTSVLLYPTKMKTTTSEGVTITDQYQYPLDMTGLQSDAETARQKLITNRQINALMEHRQTKGSKAQIMQTEYTVVGNAALPKLVKANTGKDQAMETRISYHNYDQYGNPACLSYEEGPMVIYIWGYKGQYPVAKIECNSKAGNYYDTVKGYIGTSNMNILANNPTDTQIRDIFTILRSNSNMTGALITSCTYQPLVGMTSETDPSGRTIFYEYDDFGRLSKIRDSDRNLTNEFNYNYNYRGVIHHSKAYSGDFTRNNCPEGSQGGTVFYTLPAGTETSIISQEDADRIAGIRFWQEGQAWANNTAPCNAYNVFITSGTDLQEYSITFKKGDGTVVRTVNSEQVPVSFYLPDEIYTIDIDAMESINAIVNGSVKKVPPPGSWNVSTLYPINIELKKISEAFYNSEQRGSFTKNDCPAGFGSDVTYTIPAGRYVSYVSQADANNQAIAALRANGQAYANTHGSCFTHMLTVQRSGRSGITPMLLVVKDGDENTVISTEIFSPGASYTSNAVERGNMYRIHLESMYRATVTVNGVTKEVSSSPGEDWLATAPVFINVVFQ